MHRSSITRVSGWRKNRWKRPRRKRPEASRQTSIDRNGVHNLGAMSLVSFAVDVANTAGQEASINVSRVQEPTRDKKYLATDPWSKTGLYAPSLQQLRKSLGTITATRGPSEQVLSRGLSAMEPGIVAKATLSSKGRWQIE